MIDISSLSQQSRDAITDYVVWELNLGDGLDVKRWISPEWLSYLIFVLKVAPDKPERFPRGKWATIQFLEQALLEQLPNHLAEGLKECQR